MHSRDKATLRLTLGLGLAALIAYGMALTAPYVVCVMAVILLSKPGPPLPLVKGIVAALVIAVLVAAGVVMVPLLENYAIAGILLTAVILFVIFFAGLLSGSPLTMVLVIAFAMMPVAGVIEQALVGALALSLAIGVAVGTLVGFISSAFFPDKTAPTRFCQADAPRQRRRRVDRAARDVDRDARLRPRADQSVVLPRRDHEDRHARPPGRRNQCPLRRQGTGRVDADGRRRRPWNLVSACRCGPTCGCSCSG